MLLTYCLRKHTISCGKVKGWKLFSCISLCKTLCRRLVFNRRRLVLIKFKVKAAMRRDFFCFSFLSSAIIILPSLPRNKQSVSTNFLNKYAYLLIKQLTNHTTASSPCLNFNQRLFRQRSSYFFIVVSGRHLIMINCISGMY